MTPEQFADKAVRSKILKRAHRKAERELKGLDQPKSETILEIGKLLKAKRQAKGWTLKQLQDASGIDYTHIVKIEGGKLNPTIETLDKLAKAMNCRLAVDFIRLKDDGKEG